MIITSTISPLLKINLTLLGVWPSLLSIIYGLIYASSLLILQYFQYSYLFTHFKFTELSDLAECLPVTLGYSATTVKLISLWIHHGAIQEILIIMNNDCHESINVDQHLYMMTSKANKSHFCFNAMFSINLIATALYFLGDYVLCTVHVIGDDNDTLWQLPPGIHFPFEIELSPIFKLLVITIYLHVSSLSASIAILNGFIFSMVFHVSGQIDIICQGLKTISENIQFYKFSMSKLKMLIARHNKVILLSDNIKELLSFYALTQVIYSIMLFSSLGFIVIISLFNKAYFVIARTCMSYIVVMTENLMLCVAGEYLNLQSKSIADAAYDSLWYNLPRNEIKIILFIIMRGQVQLTLTAGKFVNLSIETFANIVKASVSYISVFYTIYQ